MHNIENKFFVHKNYAYDGYDVYIRRKEHDTANVYIASNIVFTSMNMAAVRNPAITLTEADAFNLMNELWNAGIRPAGAQGSIGQLAAVQYHLEDMRKLALK